MNWTFLVLALTGVVAGPVVASMVAPGVVTELAEGGAAVSHRHFVFDRTTTVRHGDDHYAIHLTDGDLYELPLTTQLVVRGTVTPAPSDEELQGAFQKALEQYDIPILGYEVQRDGDGITVKATLPAGVLARLSPEYQRMLEKYEAEA